MNQVPAIRLAAIDLDGTLLNSQGQLTEASVNALRRLHEAGIVLAAATARWRQAALRPFEQAGVPAAAIACAGAHVSSPDGTEVAEWPLAPDASRSLVARCIRSGWTANISTPTVTYRLAPELPPWADRAPPWLRPVTSLDEGEIDRVLSVLIEGNREDSALEALRDPEHGLAVHWAQSFDGRPLLTITAEGVHKGRGLTALCEALELAPSAVAAFGDSDVDLPMFRVAGTSVAMGNATAEVQDAASFVTLSADEDGFAHAVDRFLRL